MKTKQLQEVLNEKLLEIEKIVNSYMLNDGTTCKSSQRICIIEKIKKLERCINGIEDIDLFN